MDKEDKIAFVETLVNCIVDDILIKIQSGVIPENWRGNELRALLEMKFKSTFPLEKKREKDFKNDVSVRNI